MKAFEPETRTVREQLEAWLRKTRRDRQVLCNGVRESSGPIKDKLVVLEDRLRRQRIRLNQIENKVADAADKATPGWRRSQRGVNRVFARMNEAGEKVRKSMKNTQLAISKLVSPMHQKLREIDATHLRLVADALVLVARHEKKKKRKKT